jgi:hypothetical protein
MYIPTYMYVGGWVPWKLKKIYNGLKYNNPQQLPSDGTSQGSKIIYSFCAK